MADIFICYRHNDSAGYVGHLADSLARHFPDSQIFRDLESLHAGDEFRDAIEKALSSCVVLLAVMGPRWLDSKQRLTEPGDYIRLEIGKALERGILVVPVLVGGAAIPTEDDLPDELDALAGRQVHEISDKRWDYDVLMLAHDLAKVRGLERRKHVTGLAARARGWLRRRWYAIPLALLGTIVALGLLTQFLTGGDDIEMPAGLGIVDADLTHVDYAEPNCIKPPDCLSTTRKRSEDIRLRNADIRFDSTLRQLHVRLSISWVLRIGESNLFHRGYTGQMYYVAPYGRAAGDGRVVVSALQYRGDTLAPLNGLLAFAFGWLEVPFLRERDADLRAEILRRLNAGTALQSLP